MAQYKNVVFDLDGTLLDTSSGIIESIKYTIDYFKLEPLSEEQLKAFIGPPVQNSFKRYYGFDNVKLQEIATIFRDNYKSVNLLKAKPYPGIYDVFGILVKNDIKPTVATYKRQDYATDILVNFGFNKYTDVFCGADHNNVLKKKDIIKNAIALSKVANNKEVVMVGDSDNDAIGADEIGVDFIGVTYGFGFKNDSDVNKYKNVGIAHNTKEIINIILKGDNINEN